MDLDTALRVGAVAVTVTGAAATIALGARYHRRNLSIQKSEALFRHTREHLHANRTKLAHQALRMYPDAARLPENGYIVPVILGDATWIPQRPVPLESVRANALHDRLEPAENPRTDWPGLALLSSRYWPYEVPGERWQTYDQAIERVDKPGRFFDAECYRLLGFSAQDDTPIFAFGTSRYFDYLRTCEALAYEFANCDWTNRRKNPRAANSKTVKLRNLPYRRQLGDPFDLTRRSVNCGVNTLTLIKGPSGTTFIMHQRDPKKVAAAGGVAHVVPAGEFQPATEQVQSLTADLDIWHTMMREYAEELLGTTEDHSIAVDYEHQQPYAALVDALRRGRLRPYYLGLVLDPLTLKGEILTACVFDEETFTSIFGANFARYNAARDLEGLILRGETGSVGMDFNERLVSYFLVENRTLPAGAATLALGWYHRDDLK